MVQLSIGLINVVRRISLNRGLLSLWQAALVATER